MQKDKEKFKNKFMRRSWFLFTLILGNSLLLPIATLAQSASVTDPCDTKWHLGCPIITSDCRGEEAGTKCDIKDLVASFIHVADWILALLGALALGTFVYGGFVWLTAAGNSSRVEKGRNILVGTVIGIIIVLGAFAIVRFASQALGLESKADFGQFLQ